MWISAVQLPCKVNFSLPFLAVRHVLFFLTHSLSGSQFRARGLIRLHSLNEGHVYFNRWSTMVCLFCLSVKPWVRGEEREGGEAAGIDESVDQGNVNSTVVSECRALSLRAAGRLSTQGHVSWLKANANSTEFNLKCSLWKKSSEHKTHSVGECSPVL